MSLKPEVSDSDYETLAATYQVLEAALLDSVLSKCGVSDLGQRRKICEAFIFSHGLVFDQGAFQQDGKWFSPVVNYAELAGSPQEGFQPTGRYSERDVNFSYHEYALGNLDYYFEECNCIADFEWGPKFEGEEK
jgi:hypothetical protein